MRLNQNGSIAGFATKAMSRNKLKCYIELRGTTEAGFVTMNDPCDITRSRVISCFYKNIDKCSFKAPYKCKYEHN